MKKGVVFLIFLLILISSCSREETIIEDNYSNKSVVNPVSYEDEEEIVRKDKAILNIDIISSRAYEDSDAEKGNFFVLELKIENLDNYSGFVELKASCLARDDGGSIALNNVIYSKTGKVEDELPLKPNEIKTFKLECCFEEMVGKTDRVTIDKVEAYKFI